MRRSLLILSFATSFLLLSVCAFADGVGNVDIHIAHAAGGAYDDEVKIGETNYLQIYFTNDAIITGFSTGFEFTWDATVGATFDINYAGAGNPVVNYGIAGWFPALSTTTFEYNAVSPDAQLIGGTFWPPTFLGMDVHASATLLYELAFDVTGPVAGDITDGFCVDNIMYGNATWNFTDASGGYAPDFNNLPNTATDVPDAPPICFRVFEPPCQNPLFTTDNGSAVSSNHCVDYTFTFAGSGNDPLNCPPPNDGVTFGSDVGLIGATSGVFTMAHPVDACGTTDVVITITNCCGGTATHGFTITWSNNDPVIANCGTASGVIGMGDTYTYNFVSNDADICDHEDWSVVCAGPPDPFVPGSFDIDANSGVFTFDTDNPNDGGKTFTFVATVTDDCGATDICQFTVNVVQTQPVMLQIEKTHMTIQGHYVYVSILKLQGSADMGGFDLLIAYDASALSFMSAELGYALGPLGCGWEYFTYRYGAAGNCGGPCPTGFLRVVAIADQNNGPNHPSCYNANGEIVKLKFYVTNDRTYECMYVPIRFAWFDCGDNSISTMTGDSLLISLGVWDFEWDGNPLNHNYELTGIDCPNTGYHIGGACAECDISDKTEPVRFIYFWNGGVDIACADSIDRRGDLNLNGIDNEIADAVVYTNYFLFGPTAFHINYDGQTAASDVNADGIPLSVGDLVYLLRIITGDSFPYPKLAPFADAATINVVNGVVSTEAAPEIGAVWATFNVNGAYDVLSHTDMVVLSNEVDGMLNVLVYSGTDNMTNRIPGGINDLFTVSGNVELVSVQVADYNGNMLETTVNKTVLPTDFALMQNVPNPFNPTTKIGFDLPVVSDYTLDIYNVAGQRVHSASGHGVGSIVVEWDASNVASGVYFYKLTAGNFTDTKKMVLMK